MHVREILYPTDFSPCARLAFVHAARLARCYGGRLHLLHVVPLHRAQPYDPMFYVAEPRAAYERAEREALAELRRLSREGAVAGARAVVAVRRAADPAAAIVDYAREQAIDLVVMGTHGRRGAERLPLGSHAEDVLRHCACPVLTVRESEPVPPPARASRTLLVPFDFSPPARAALVAAAGLARRCPGQRLRLLHAVEEPPPAPADPRARAELLEGRELRLHQLGQRLRDALDHLAPGLPGEALLGFGRPAEVILRASEEAGVGLVVLATRGASGVKRQLFGATAEEVLRLARRPVLVIRPDAGRGEVLRPADVIADLPTIRQAAAAAPAAAAAALRRRPPLTHLGRCTPARRP